MNQHAFFLPGVQCGSGACVLVVICRIPGLFLSVLQPDDVERVFAIVSETFLIRDYVVGWGDG